MKLIRIKKKDYFDGGICQCSYSLSAHKRNLTTRLNILLSLVKNKKISHIDIDETLGELEFLDKECEEFSKFIKDKLGVIKEEYKRLY